jgi:hypothetical protein
VVSTFVFVTPAQRASSLSFEYEWTILRRMAESIYGQSCTTMTTALLTFTAFMPVAGVYFWLVGRSLVGDIERVRSSSLALAE